MLRSMLWVLLLAAIWFLLTRGDLASWLVGVPFIVLAILTGKALESAATHEKSRINLLGLLRFLLFFARESLSGAINVARSALLSMKPIESCLHDYEIRIKQPHAQQLFIMSISLVPGTLCADWKGNTARIHVLDKNIDYLKGIRALECRVAAMFGEQYDHR